MRKSILECSVVVWINFGKAVGILPAEMASCAHESLWRQRDLWQYIDDGELKPWERWSKKCMIFKLEFSKTMVYWTTYVMVLFWNMLFWQDWQYIEKNATGSMGFTRTAACNFATGNPWIVIVEVNGLFLSLTFFADALNMCTRNSVISIKRDNRRSIFQWRA